MLEAEGGGVSVRARGGCDSSEADSSLLSPVLSTSHYTEEPESPQSVLADPASTRNCIAPRVIDEKLDFKHPLETIEMSP